MTRPPAELAARAASKPAPECADEPRRTGEDLLSLLRPRFERPEDFSAFQAFWEGWDQEPGPIQEAFGRLAAGLAQFPETRLTFDSRPGISHSLRAGVCVRGSGKRTLFSLVDAVEDQASGRFLSVCFYASSVQDPEDRGNLITEGLLGEDGYCFDVFGEDEALMAYLEARVLEAYRAASPQ